MACGELFGMLAADKKGGLPTTCVKIAIFFKTSKFSAPITAFLSPAVL